MKTNKTELLGIQCLRGFAAAIVLLHHILEESLITNFGVPLPDSLVMAGAVGVDIFFVISGFIMVYVTKERFDQTSPQSFLLRRAIRVYPLYWCICLMTLALKFIGFFGSMELSLPMILNSVALLPTQTQIVGVAWTLNYEMLFYLLFAIGLLARKLSWLVVWLFLCIGTLFSYGVLFPENPYAWFFGNSVILEFLLGVTLGLLFLNQKLPTPNRLWIGVITSFSIALIFWSSFEYAHLGTGGLNTVWRGVFWGIPSMLIVYCSLSWQLTSEKKKTAARFAGASSYAIYLSHPLVMIAYAFSLKHFAAIAALPQILVIPFVFMAATLWGSLIHITLEKPMMQMLTSKRSTKKPSTIAVTSNP